MNKFRSKIIIASALAGLCTIVLGILLTLTFPMKADLPKGFRTPIIAFEFAKSEDDLSYLKGNSQEAKENRRKMDKGHQFDMMFPFAYGSFLALLLLQLIMSGHRFAWIGIPFALLIIPFDLNENFVLLNITEALSNAKPVTQLLLDKLHIATWLKWGSTGMAIGVLSFGLIKDKKYLPSLLALVTFLSIDIGWILGSKPVVVETMSGFVALFFLYFSISSSIQAWKIIKAKPSEI